MPIVGESMMEVNTNILSLWANGVCLFFLFGGIDRLCGPKIIFSVVIVSVVYNSDNDSGLNTKKIFVV